MTSNREAVHVAVRRELMRRAWKRAEEVDPQFLRAQYPGGIDEYYSSKWMRYDSDAEAITDAALAAMGEPKVRVIAEDAKRMCEEGHPVSAFNLANMILRALDTQGGE
eukprot:NODE_4646_length_764_cov_1.119309_g4623_i0.p2 GENE.NODE_4646_length_764_cov_1.119309_g4623_i0~~NODE_4646_length_764_cov_1.119309_g4623_i0.p2  ORF type:complete len:108 (+),score=17.27 NODE_4646_length_764_cov_1.119309_g4623_i0:401-724(+)